MSRPVEGSLAEEIISLMLSLHAMKGSHVLYTMRFVVRIGVANVIFLVDLGSLQIF